MPMDRTEFHEGELSEEERETASRLPIIKRQRMISNMICPHPLYLKAKEFVHYAYKPVPGGAPNMGRITALYAPYRSGKSTAMRHAAEEIRRNDDGTASPSRVVYYRCHSNLGAADFFGGLYRAVTGLAAPKGSCDLIQGFVGDLMPQYGCELLLLDNLQAAMARPDMSRKINGFLIELLEKSVCHVMVSGPPELDTAIRVREEIVGRGGLLNPDLQPYDWHTIDGRKSFRTLLHMIDKRLPFRKLAGLGAESVAAHFYDLHGPAIGFALDLVYYAGANAMNENADCIRPEHLAMAAALARAPGDRFTHFVDVLDPEVVGRR